MQDLFYRKALQAVGDGILFIGAGEEITFCNRAFLDMVGYGEADILGKNWRLLERDETPAELAERIRGAIAKRERFEGEVIAHRKGGGAFRHSLSILPQFDENGDFVGLIAKLGEGHRGERQRDLDAFQKHSRVIFENIGTGVMICSPDGVVRKINPEAMRSLGLSPSTEGRTIERAKFDLIKEDGSPFTEEDCLVKSVMERGEAVRDAIIGKLAGGSGGTQWFHCNALPIVEPTGEISTVILYFNDISQRRNHELAAKADQRRFQLALRAARSVVCDWDLLTEEFWASESFETVFGSSPPSTMGLTEVPQYVVEEDRDRYQRQLLQALAQQDRRLQREFRFVRPEGGIGTLRSEFTIHYDDDGEPVRIIGSTIDVTELRQKEEKLASSEERLRIVTELSSDILWEMNPDTEVVWRAAEGVERLGLDPDLAPYSGGAWIDQVSPEDRERVVSSLSAALEGGADRWREEYRMQKADGSTLLVQDTAALIRDENGAVTRVVGAVRDITESRRLEDFLRNKQSLESLGKLTGGVAHDFNNMLMIIMGNTEILLDETDDPDVCELLDLIQSAARNGAELTSRLLSFARQQPLAPQRMNIAEQMEQIGKLIRHGLPEDITLSVTASEEDLFVEVDPSQLDNALVNLAMNARDAMPEGGLLTLEASSYRVELGALENVLAPGEYVRIAMTDSGSGMAPEIASRVFEPFFTTKARGDGTGLGLSMVYGFANQSGGHAFVETAPGEGTTVCIFLPKIEPIEGEAESRGTEYTFPRDSAAKILIVEDEGQVRRYVEKLFKAEGYSVLSASNGPDAMALLDRHDDVDLLFTDIVMPGGMNGLELAEKARHRLPGIKVIFSSGYASMRTLGDSFDPGRDMLLLKPYTRMELAKALKRVTYDPVCD